MWTYMRLFTWQQCSPFTTEASLQKKHVTQHWVHDKQIMVVSVISLWYNKIGWWNLEWTDKGQSAVGVGRHIREGPGVLPNFYACKRGCVAGSVRDGKCHSDESKVSWRAAEPWPRMERESWKTEEKREMQGKVQHNNKKKVATAETEREGTKRKKNKRKQVCGGPTSNPASALGFRNRGVISVKTHSQPAYCLNEATFAPLPPPPKNLFLFSFIISLAITHTKWRKTWKLSIALF